MNPIAVIPVKKRFLRKARQRGTSSPTPVALNLVAANYGSFSLTLVFDRAIDISAINPAVIFVDDPDRETRFQGGSDYSLVDPNTVTMSMESSDDYEGSQTLLDAGADSGIVATDDGGTWAGADGVGLPFP